MKIGILSCNSINDSSNWSGSGFFLPHYLMEKYEIFDIPVRYDFLARVLRRLSRLFCHKYNKVYFYYLQKKAKYLINKSHKKYHLDAILVLGETIFFGKNVFPKSLKIISLSDATEKLRQGYYWINDKHDFNLFNTFESNAFKRSDICIAASKWCYDSIVNDYNTLPRKVFILPFPSYLNDQLNCSYNRNYRGKTTFNILLVGVDFYRKGVDTAILVLKELNNNKYGLKFKLNIVGLNNPDPTMYSDSNLRFYGKLLKSDQKQLQALISLYNCSDIFLLPTRAECAGIVFSEASMFGLPIFTSKTGGVGTYVIDGFNGRKFDLGDKQYINMSSKIIEVIKNGDLDKLSNNATYFYKTKLSKNAWLKGFEEIITNNL